MNNIKVFFQSLRVSFVSVTLSGVLLGTATAFFVTRRMELIPFLVVAFVAVTGHVSANLFNDYFDHRSGNDVINKNITPLSGGSRAIQEGGLSDSKVLLSACLFLVLSVFAGCWFVYAKQDMDLAYFGLAGLVLGYAYTAPPFKLVYRGLGELTIIITFGLFIVGGAYLAQTGNITNSAIVTSLPAGLLTAVILIVNGFPDRVADETSGKRTFIVLYGKEVTILLIKKFVLLSYAITLGGVLSGILPFGALACLVSLPIAVQFLKKVDRIEEDFLPAGIAAIALQTTFVLSTAFGIAISVFPV
ncbi:MAG: prenyltransferase [Candidatus Parcubacteria bacterium]|nr:prenyltransferase [Candidatus Parcubacteria bacterium]